MTPEEKFNQEIWWILQEIKHEEYRTPKGKEVEFFIKKNIIKKGNQRMNIDSTFPEEEVQRKLLDKLKEWGVISFEPVNDILRGSDIYSPSIYALKIKKPKFDEFYKKYESGNSSKKNEQWVEPILRKLKDGSILLEDSLPEKIDFDYDNDLQKLIDYIDREGRVMSFYEDKDFSKSFIFLNPAAENYRSFMQFNSFVFLVYLSREKIVTDLYLPVYIKEKIKIDGEKLGILQYKPPLIDWGERNLEGSIRSHLEYGTSLFPRVIRFIIKDWTKFLKIKNELEAKESEKNVKKNSKSLEEKHENGLDFDLVRSVLYINEHKIKVKKFSDQYHLLRILFEDKNELKKDWFFSEISEKYEGGDELPDKKFYNAIYQLNQKIAIETGVKDFFITTVQSFQINNNT